MKITFIDPPNWTGEESVERVFGCNLTIYPVPNIFILTTAAVLRDDGHQVKYIDSANYYWTESQFKDFAAGDDSDILSIHSVNLSKEIDLAALKFIRRIKKDVPVVFTGPSPTYFREEFLEDENTYVVRGEPELAFKELVRSLSDSKDRESLQKIEGLSYLKDGKAFHNPTRPPISDLDSLPPPARSLLDKKLYFNPKIGVNPWTVLQTSRGCGYRCIYCVPCSLSFSRELEHKRFYGKKPPVRMRSVENVVKEFRLLKQEGYKSVSIIDDSFIFDESRALAICEGIKDLGIQWGCLGRPDHIRERVVAAMAGSGCQYVDLGAESFDQKVLDYIHKDLKVEDIFEAVRVLKKYGIDVKLNILLGASPLETKDSILKNARVARGLKPSTIMFSIVSPFPGTEWYEIVKEKGWFDSGDYRPTYLQKRAIVSYPNLSSNDLNRLLRRATYSYYLSFSFIVQGLRRIKSFRGLCDALIAYWRKLNFEVRY